MSWNEGRGFIVGVIRVRPGECHLRPSQYGGLGLCLQKIFDAGWLGSRKGIRPAKKLSDGMLAWLCVWVKMQICI